MNKKDFYFRLKKEVASKEREYDDALDKLSNEISKLNKAIISNQSTASIIPLVTKAFEGVVKCDYNLQVAILRLSIFLKEGIIKYE